MFPLSTCNYSITMSTGYHHGDLKAELLAYVRELMEHADIDGLSMREMAKAVTINGQLFPGDIASPKDGDITIQWTAKNLVSIYVVVRTVDCPKGITVNIMLDLSLNNGEG